jgi:uncharacterized protein (TIGR02271 family)
MKHLNLSRHPDAQFPDSIADVRGFEVRSRDMDEKIGKVDDLIYTADGRIRYLDVGLGGFFNPKHVALPIGIGQVDRANDVIWLSGVTKDQLEELPEFTGDPDRITDDYETLLRRTFGSRSAGKADVDLYDQGRFYAERGGTAAGDARLVLSEEELNVGKRQVRAGEVGVRKTVETEHVSKKVPLVREEVTVERRPITDRTAAAKAEIREDEVRIPVMAEEAVVEKRAVPKEEIVVRKRQVTEEQTVEADLRRERFDESGLREAADVNATARKGRGVADKIADKADDLKDRMDGNPASKPGPDRTDRPERRV